MRSVQKLLISASLLGLSACGTQVSAPSLMPRAVEKQPIDMPVEEAAEPQGPADPALQTALARQIDAAQAGDKDFTERRAAAENAVAKAAGKAQGGEEWVQAQEAITALESARAAVRDAAAAIDALRDNPAYAAPGNRAAIDAAARQVSGIEDAQSAAVAALAGKLG
ncbi:MAG: hypothetical protein JF628_10745 [Sphingomonas sp.]|nr:hypothetical protein [Sphingomonas sp.]